LGQPESGQVQDPSVAPTVMRRNLNSKLHVDAVAGAFTAKPRLPNPADPRHGGRHDRAAEPNDPVVLRLLWDSDPSPAMDLLRQVDTAMFRVYAPGSCDPRVRSEDDVANSGASAHRHTSGASALRGDAASPTIALRS
jgi:hypothetical protein